MDPHGSTETQIPKKHQGEKSKEDEKGKLNGHLKVKHAKTNQCKAEKAYKNVGDEHGPVIKARFRLEFLPTYCAMFVHAKGMQHVKCLLKKTSLPATGTGKTENTTKSAHVKRCQLIAGKDIIYGNQWPVAGS